MSRNGFEQTVKDGILGGDPNRIRKISNLLDAIRIESHANVQAITKADSRGSRSGMTLGESIGSSVHLSLEGEVHASIETRAGRDAAGHA
jgi:hypothetical protein